MAVHVTCGSGGVLATYGIVPVEGGKLDWSETLSSPGVTVNKVTSISTVDTAFASRVLTITAMGEAAWVAVGPGVPNAGVDPRRYCPADIPVTVTGRPGDRVAYAVVS